MPLDRRDLDQAVDESYSSLTELASRLHEHPELAYQEHRASSWIAELLEASGVRVERALGGVETAFRARVGNGSGPRVAILAEYDALPEIGHACGHNLIAAGAVGAFLAFARQRQPFGGTVELIGTPAEEGGGGKIRLIEAGAFRDVDVAMMYHPYDRDILAHPALATTRTTLTYKGAPAHAAIAPWDGNSALTACLETFRLIDSQRVHFRDGVRVHGIVTDGGQAVNVIPERAASVFLLRAPSLSELARVREIVERCARGAALASGVEVDVQMRAGYKNMRNNLTLARRFGAALETLGRKPRESDTGVGAGSTDMGDVSHLVPSIHPYLAICDEGETLCHERAFAACARSPRGFETMRVAAKAMARTTAEVLEDSALLSAAREEFELGKHGS
ncbi:MAG TPA: M20 family metallopeptidase [Polyangiaceae bacterium]|nr:M20 family metallopeptidase [Polyangiaceae bacterium]